MGEAGKTEEKAQYVHLPFIRPLASESEKFLPKKRKCAYDAEESSRAARSASSSCE